MGILLNKSKNYIINGAMDYWQRGTSFVTATGGYYADRFLMGKNGTMVHTVSRDTDVPTLAQSGFTFPYSYRMTLTTPQASIAAGNYQEIYQYIEGSVASPLYDKDITLSFWVKANLTGKYYVAFRNAGGARSLVRSFDVNVSNAWEKKTITIRHDVSGGTWTKDNSTGIIVSWTIAGGSTFTAPAENVWYSTNYNNGPGQVNGVQAGATDFRITGVQLEEGVSASNFERAGGNTVNELQLCRRYCEVFTNLSAGQTFATGLFTTATAAAFPFRHLETKRAIPNVNVITPGAFRFSNGSNNYRGLNFIATTPGLDASAMVFSITTSATVNAPFSADCDNTGGTGSIIIDAEL